MKNNFAVEEVACNLCGSRDFTVKIKPRKKEFDPDAVFSASHGIMGTQQVVKCRQCGLMYVNPRISAERVVSAYRNSEDELYVSQEKARIQTFAGSLNLVERYAPQRGKILDVGAAAGFFLTTAKARGWDPFGVEPSQWLAEWGNRRYGVNIRPGVLASARFAPGMFDVVTMWDVLEHTPDPMAELKETNRVLKDRGVLVINYPNIGSLLARVAGSRWWFLLSVHLYYFTHDSLRQYLEKTGFQVLKINRYFQKLELEHLLKMVGLYSPFLSNVGLVLARGLHIHRWQIPYYAAQANLVAVKIREAQ